MRVRQRYVAVTVNMDQLMQTETNHRKCVMDHIEKKGKPEQVPNEHVGACHREQVLYRM